MGLHFFTPDGQYGAVDGMVIVDTTDWKESDWATVNEARDIERPATARVVRTMKDGAARVFDTLIQDVS